MMSMSMSVARKLKEIELALSKIRSDIEAIRKNSVRTNELEEKSSFLSEEQKNAFYFCRVEPLESEEHDMEGLSITLDGAKIILDKKSREKIIEVIFGRE